MTGGLERLARLAGLSSTWTDAFGVDRTVAPETLARVLDAFGLPCASASQIESSAETLAEAARLPRLITAEVGRTIRLPATQDRNPLIEMDFPDGRTRISFERVGNELVFEVPGEPGYYAARLGSHDFTIAVAPERAPSVMDLTGRARASGMAVQIYGLRRTGDGGIGDFGALADSAGNLAEKGLDAVAISPVHALFSADPGRSSPYAPSSRLTLNPLLADPGICGKALVEEAWRRCGMGSDRIAGEKADLIDWPRAGRAKLSMMRALFEGIGEHSGLMSAFSAYRSSVRPDVLGHAVFEAIQSWQLRENGPWDWRNWPRDLLDSSGPGVAAFARAHADEVDFHLFLQWMAETSIARTQQAMTDAGMGIGLIADLAVGMDPSGSHAWSHPDDLLSGLTIGAPPDLLNRQGQNWGLTAFSPTAVTSSGYEPFLKTLRAALRHAGGIRIDHVLGLRRLWLVPDGAAATEGAYLDYPLEDFLRLIALEAHLAGALVVGEDLGTVPEGFREKLAARGILGMRVLPFEVEKDGSFIPPSRWQADAMAMTSTHDMQPIAGWWTGRDEEWRAQIADKEVEAEAQEERETAKTGFWDAAKDAGIAEQDRTGATPQDAVDAAIAYVAATPCVLAIVPVEDILGLEESPNLPGTVDEHPNWRRRLARPLDEALAEPRAARRLATLTSRGRAG